MASQAVAVQGAKSARTTVYHRTTKIDGLDIFYREAGDPSKPTVLLLHGFPTSSHMFRNLMPALADEFHLVAPDYPGYGNSSMPSVDEFDYTFDRLSQIVDHLVGELGIQRYSLYLMDYGAPVGFRIATPHPERVQTLIIQNGNAYDEGIDNDFWEPIKAYWQERGAVNQGLDNNFWKNVKAAYKQPNMANEDALRFLVTLGATQWQYTNGVRNKEVISPDNWHVTQRLLDRPGNEAIQLQLFYDYGSKAMLPSWGRVLTTPDGAKVLGGNAEALATWESTELTNDGGETIRVDHYIREGSIAPELPFPHILGGDGAGEVAELGEGVTGFEVGERVIPSAWVSPER